MKRFRLRRWLGTRFVARAPTKEGGEVDLRVVRLAPSHVLWWHAHVQPVVDRDPARADRGWCWPLFAPFSQAAERAPAHRLEGFTVGMVVEDGGREERPAPLLVPLALLLVVGRARALDRPGRDGVFVWYLSTAPAGALTAIPELPLPYEQVPRRLGAIALDTALTHSFNTGRQGRMALHAADRGDDALLAWYRSRRMRVHPEGRPLPFDETTITRPSGGRYCYYTIPDAIAASRDLDDLR